MAFFEHFAKGVIRQNRFRFLKDQKRSKSNPDIDHICFSPRSNYPGFAWKKKSHILEICLKKKVRMANFGQFGV